MGYIISHFRIGVFMYYLGYYQSKLQKQHYYLLAQFRQKYCECQRQKFWLKIHRRRALSKDKE